MAKSKVAYFSAEIGISPSLHTYSGGLGILAGDHIKSAADLDVDMIVVGSHGWGAMYQLLMGSVSKGILQKSRYPVMVVPTHNRG